ncbi:MAG: hypothetical protein F6K65_35180 [Moorea sp. SIO3C2]|nr:hypothetical protein [Moorena sp. SIO3C2]
MSLETLGLGGKGGEYPIPPGMNPRSDVRHLLAKGVNGGNQEKRGVRQWKKGRNPEMI